MRRLFLLILTAALPLAASAQTWEYLIPVWAKDLPGRDASWNSEISVTNAGGSPVTVRVKEVYPAIQYQFCHPIIYCGPQLPRVFEPGDVLPVTPDYFRKSIAYTLAAVLIESDEPVRVDSWIRGISESRTINQEIEVARQWIPSRVRALIPERYYFLGNVPPNRTNVYVVNPNDDPLVVTYRAVYRGTQRPPDLSGAITVPPRSLASTEAIPAYHGTGDLPMFPRIEISAPGEFYATASDLDEAGDAIFRVPTWEGSER